MIFNKYRKTGTYPIKNFKKPMKGESKREVKHTDSIKLEEPSSLSCFNEVNEMAPR